MQEHSRLLTQQMPLALFQLPLYHLQDGTQITHRHRQDLRPQGTRLHQTLKIGILDNRPQMVGEEPLQHHYLLR